ncbi:MAG TPA: anti-sigma factor [Candidatus Binatia bacterium]|nr:anti-sigma factor [Candidatus Binatia bacterium]
MTCRTIRKKLPGYLDGALSASEHAALSRHLPGCEECRGILQDYTRMAGLLARTESAGVPADLALRIRLAVAAARRDTWLARMRRAARRMLEDILEPLAVPATGGVAMSLLIYAFVLHSLLLGVPVGAVPNDQPTQLFRPARLQTLSAVPAMAAGPFVPALGPEVGPVEFTINEHGQAVSYQVLYGTPDRATLRQLDHLLLFSQFQPQLSFGQPISGGRVVVQFDELQVRD